MASIEANILSFQEKAQIVENSKDSTVYCSVLRGITICGTWNCESTRSFVGSSGELRFRFYLRPYIVTVVNIRSPLSDGVLVAAEHQLTERNWIRVLCYVTILIC